MLKPINRVVPAVLADNPVALESMLHQVELFSDWAQIDIMDGKFVPSVSINSGDIAKDGLKIGWEAHLMVTEPMKYIDGFYLAGAKRIVVHYEAVKGLAFDVIGYIKSLGIGAGIAINPETQTSVLKDELVSQLEGVLFMSVHPGFYGAKFIPEVLDKIGLFRQRFPNVNIGIDGGVKANNIARVAQCGVNEICVGSAIFAQPDPAASFRDLSALAKTGWQNQT